MWYYELVESVSYRRMTDERFRITPVVYIVLIRDGKVLLSKRKNTGWGDGHYDLVGGHIDDGESFREAVVREAKEEADIDISVEDVSVAHVMQHVHVAYVSVFLAAKRWSGNGVLMESEKCDDLGWFPIDGLPEAILPYVATGLRNIQEGVFYSEETFLTEKASSRATDG
jgi:8-oxo-dGTP pyrophosphatase MutT (NUDIX family)